MSTSFDTLKLTPYPFPGLRPFNQEEADIFFGRDEQTDQILNKLEDNRFVAVIGPSGCGKSSLVRAGVIPSLEGGFLTSAGLRWRVAIMKPGRTPLRNLANELLDSGLFDSISEDPQEDAAFLEATLGRGPLGLVDAMQSAILEKQENLLLLVDQFEELFRLDRLREPGEARAFVDLLLATARHAEVAVYVVITMRSDFLGHCPIFAGLPEAINDSQFLTPRLTRDQAMAAIQGPLAMFNCRIDDAVVNRIVNEMGRDPDRLPLMQHLLMQMWKQVSRAAGAVQPEQLPPVQLTMQHYEAAGTLNRALEQHVSRVFGDLSERQKSIAECLFRRLTEITPDGQMVRRPTLLREIRDASGATLTEIVDVIDHFRAEGRSFLFPAPPEPLTLDSTIDISHEKLISQWPRLKSWTEDESRSQETAAMVKRRAETWQNAGQRTDALLVGLQLEEALDWSRKHPADVNDLSRQFLNASQEYREQEIRRHEALKYTRALGYCGLCISVLFGLACVLLVVLILQARANEKSRLVGDAIDSLKSGDLPGTLLWLGEAAKKHDAKWIRKDDTNQLRRVVALRQLPKPRRMLFANPPHIANGQSGGQKTAASYAGVAASSASDPSLLVALRRESQKRESGDAENLWQKSFTFLLHVMDPRDDSSREPVTLTVPSTTVRNGDVAFVDEDRYLLVAAGNLYFVPRDQLVQALSDLQGHKVRPQRVQGFQPRQDRDLVAMASDGHRRLATIESSKSTRDERRLRLWRITANESGLAVKEEEFPELNDVQFVRLTERGNLIVIRRVSRDGGAASARLMQLWHRSEAGWQSVPPVPWAIKARQRWHSWGWMATQEGWVELDSFVRSAGFNQAGNLLATASDDGEVRVWGIIPAPEDAYQTQSASGSSSPQFQVLPMLEKTIRLGATVFDLAFVDDDRIITAGRDRTARIWNLRFGTEVIPRTYHEGTVVDAMMVDSHLLVTNTARILRVWDVQESCGPTDPPTCHVDEKISVSQDNLNVLCTSYDEDEQVANIYLNKVKQGFAPQGRIQLAQLSADGKLACLVSTSEGSRTCDLAIWNATEEKVHRLPHDRFKTTHQAAFSNSGTLLAIAGSGKGDNQAIAMWKRRPGGWSEVRVAHAGTLPTSLKVSRLTFAEFEGSDLLVAAGSERVQDRERGIVLLGLLTDDVPNAMSKIKLFPLGPREGPADSFAHEERVLYAAFDRTASWLITTDQHDYAKVWKVASLIRASRNVTSETEHLDVAPHLRPLKHSSDVVFAQFNDALAHGREAMFVTVSSEGEAAVWSTGTKQPADPTKCLKFKVSHDGKVTFASFDRTGKWMITASQDSTARIWDAEQGDLIGILRHAGPVERAGFTPDDSLLTISKAGDGERRVAPLAKFVTR